MPRFRVRAYVRDDRDDEAPSVALGSFVLEASDVQAAIAEAQSCERVIKSRYLESYGRDVSGPLMFNVTPLDAWIDEMLECGKELLAARDESGET